MGQLSQYIKSSYELDTEFRLNDIKFHMSNINISAETKHNFNLDEEVYPGEIDINSFNKISLIQDSEESDKGSNVEDTKLNPETETEFKEPDPDEPAKKNDKGFDERKKNKNQPL